MNLARLDETTAPQPFLALFSRLCVGLREAQDDSGITQQVYYEALRDLPLQALETAAMALLREKGRKWFPTTAEWRTAAEEAQAHRVQTSLRAVRAQPWRHECDTCEDSGWVMDLTCDGGTTCGRTTRHLPHTYTVPCPCRPTNATYRRRQALGGGAA